MTGRASIRDLRNDTRSVIERARREGRVILTSNGTDIAMIVPLHSDWEALLADVLDAVPPQRDTGFIEWLADDDSNSVDDLP